MLLHYLFKYDNKKLELIALFNQIGAIRNIETIMS